MDRKKHITFLCSKPTLQEFYAIHPEEAKSAQFVLLGRSNVGKSSLINHFFEEPIAKSAKKPGKTAMLQFFRTFLGLFIDVPGYGFAKTAKHIQASWGKAIQSILENNPQLKCVLFLLDIRREEPNAQDHVMLNWMRSQNVPFLIIFTKMDKCKKNAQKRAQENLERILKIEKGISYSIKEEQGKKELLYRLKNGKFI